MKANRAGIQAASQAVGCEVAAISPVVDAPRGGFLKDGRVRIFFERHKFHKFTDGVFSATHTDISNKADAGSVTQAGHGKADLS
jgi:N-acetylmuramidase